MVAQEARAEMAERREVLVSAVLVEPAELRAVQELFIPVVSSVTTTEPFYFIHMQQIM
jgi:hypothetical protein